MKYQRSGFDSINLRYSANLFFREIGEFGVSAAAKRKIRKERDSPSLTYGPAATARSRGKLDLLLEGNPAHISQDSRADDKHDVHQQAGILEWGQTKLPRNSQDQVCKKQDKNDDRNRKRGNAKPFLHRDFPSFNGAIDRHFM